MRITAQAQTGSPQGFSVVKTYPEGVPKRRAVEYLPSRRNGNTDEAEECEEDRNDEELDVLGPLIDRVTL